MVIRLLLSVGTVIATLGCLAAGSWWDAAEIGTEPSTVSPSASMLRTSGAEPAHPRRVVATTRQDCDLEIDPRTVYFLTPARAGAALYPLDPDTLEDRPGCAWLAHGPYGLSRRSPDGALMATIASDVPVGGAPHFAATVIVREMQTGEAVSRFDPPGPIGSELRFSADGTTLLVQGWYASWRPEAVSWYAVDAATGELVATVPAEPRSSSHPFFVTESSLLYRLLFRSSMEPGGSYPPTRSTEPGPWPTEIVVNELSAGGAELRRLALPAVRAGSWWSEREVAGHRVPVQILPGVALSPDRDQLALAHADEDAVTIVDLTTLAVTRTVMTRRPSTLGERLGLGARSAFAKAMDASVRQARFVDEGRLVVVWGYDTRVEERGAIAERGLPLRLVDPPTGRILGELAVESPVREVLPSPDGRSLFVSTFLRSNVTGASARRAAQPTVILRRLDMTTLAVRAQREITGDPGMLYGVWREGVEQPGLLIGG